MWYSSVHEDSIWWHWMILVVPRKLTDDFASKVRAIRHLFATLCKIVIYRVPLSSTQTPLVQHIGSTHGPNLFGSLNPSVQHNKSLSSTPKTPQFNTLLSITPKNPSSTQTAVPYKGCVELRSFRCGTEGEI